MSMRYGMITKGKYKDRLCHFTNTIAKTHNYMCYPIGGNPYCIVIDKIAIKELTKSQFNLVKVADKYDSVDR